MDIDSDENENFVIEDSPELLKELDDILKNVLPIAPTSNKMKQTSPLHKKRWKWFQRHVKLDQHPDINFQLPRARRSSVWTINLYRSLFYKRKLQNFVICQKCKTLLTYKSKKGVTNLLKHKCYAETLKILIYDENDINVSFVLPSTIFPTDKNLKNQLKEFRFVRQNGILINFVYCIKCRHLFYAKPGIEVLSDVKRHTDSHLVTLCKLSLLSRSEKLKEKLEFLIRTSDSSVKLYLIEKSSDRNCVWFYNIFRLIEYDCKIQSFIYCINCTSLILYDLNDEQSEENNETVLKHKCVITVYRDTDFEKTETVTDWEHQLTFEIKILDEESDDNFDDTNVLKSLKITLPPMLIDLKYMKHRLLNRGQFMESCIIATMEKPSTEVVEPITSRLSSSSSSTSLINEFNIEKRITLSQLYLKFITINYLPLEIFETKSFNRLARSLMFAGKLYGKFKIEQYWLSLIKIDLNLRNHVAQIKNQLKTKFLNEKFAYSCDIWENVNEKTLNLSLRAHFVDKSFNLITILLGTRTINAQHIKKNTNDWLIECSLDILVNCLIQTPINCRRQFAQSLLLQCSGFVSMHKRKIKSQIKNILKCAATSLNEIVNNILYFESDEMFNLSETILNVLLKSTSKSSLSFLNLKREIKNCNLKDWVSIFNFLLTFKDLILVLTNEEQNQNINSLIKLLRPIKLAIQCLGNIESKIPTINMVCVVKHKLINDLAGLKGECTIFESVRAQMLVSILHEFVINDLHKIASFLDPRFKALKFLSDNERKRILDLVNGMIIDNNSKIGKTSYCDNTQHLTEYMDNDCSVADENLINKQNEISYYFNMPTNKCFPNNENKNQNKNVVLDFWNKHPELPKLSALAKQILSIPASANVQACKFSPEAIDLINKRSLQMYNGIRMDIAHVIHGNFHLVEFQ